MMEQAFMHGPWGIGPMVPFLGVGGIVFSILFLLIVILWTLLWKALALWHAARNRQKIWFVILLIINTIGILEIIYLVWFCKDENASGSSSLFGMQKLSETFPSKKETDLPLSVAESSPTD